MHLYVSVVFKACCHGVKQLEKSLLTDRPPAEERSPTERRGGNKGDMRGDRTEERKEERMQRERRQTEEVERPSTS